MKIMLFVEMSRSKKFGGDASAASNAAHRAQAAEQAKHSLNNQTKYYWYIGIIGVSIIDIIGILTNEKRGGLNLVSFDWPPFKLFSLRFSKESVQTPSCERPKTAQRTLFMSFEINNCFPITA